MRTFPLLFFSSDDHDRPIPEILVNLPALPTLTPTPLRLVGLNFLPALSPPSVQENLSFVVPGEVPPQIVAEARLIPPHNEQVSRHFWSSWA